MDLSKITTGIIIVVVSVILAGVLVIPVIQDVTASEDTFTNEGAFNYGIFTPDDEYTLNYSSDGKITVNDVDVPSFNTDRAYSVIASENFTARYGVTGGNYYMQCIGVDQNNAVFADGGVSATVTISGGKLSVSWTSSTDVTTTKTVVFSEMYAIVPTEDQAVMKYSTEEVYIKGDSQIYATGITTVVTWRNIIHFEGTYEDGITISSPDLTGATFDNVVWNVEPVNGYIDLYRLTSIEFDITYEDTTVHATYSYFGVPSEITAERSNHMNSSQAVIMGVVSVLVLVSIVMVAVRMISGRSD